MSNTMTAISAKTFRAVINGKKVDVHYCRFVAMANDIYDTLRYGDHNRATNLYERAISGYERMIKEPKYMMPYPYYPCESNDWKGSAIYEVPEDFNGTFDEYDQEKFNVIGTLVEDGNKKKIETDLVLIEKIRRTKEVEKIKNGSSIIYFTKNEADLKKPEKYLKHLEEKDEKNGEFVTRGHGL